MAAEAEFQATAPTAAVRGGPRVSCQLSMVVRHFPPLVEQLLPLLILSQFLIMQLLGVNQSESAIDNVATS